MDATSSIAIDLFYKVRSRFSGLKLGDDSGQIVIVPESARFFDFDYKDGEKKVGHVTVSIAEPNSMKVYYSTSITESMDSESKSKWFKFLRELRQFAKRRLMSFDTRDIAKDNLDKRDYAFLSKNENYFNSTATKTEIGENVMSESQMYGTRKTSYQPLQDTRLIIKHSKPVMDEQSNGARTRNISALFVENASGERFKYPFVHLAGARAMQRHVANGGLPYDEIGESIIKMSEQIAQLKSFSNYVVRNDLMNSDTNSLIERGQTELESLKKTVKNISKQSHYENYVENFSQAEDEIIPEDIEQELTNKFTIKNFQEEIKTVFPILYKFMKENENVGYDDIVKMTQVEEQEEQAVQPVNYLEDLENWILTIDESSDIQSQDQEVRQRAVENLQKLVGESFPAGNDGMNAINALKGIIEDPKLVNEIKEQAKEDPNQDVRGLVKDWLDENATEVVEELDFGDYEEEQSAVGADEVEPQEESFEDFEMQDEDTNELNKLLGLAGMEEDSKFDRNFEKRIAAKVKGGKGAEYMSKKADQARQQNKDLDPGAAEKGLGIGVLDREKAYAKAKKKGAKFPSRGVTTSPNTRDPSRLPEQEKTKDLPFEPDENPTDKDEFGNTIKKKNLPKHLAKKGMRKSMDIKEVAEFIMSFYDRNQGTFPKGPEGVATMVGKKFGEQAEQVARKMVERMAPHQEQGAEELEELAKIRRLSGM